METTAIEYFIDIADGSTYWEVAEKNHISQSSVSKAIVRLENDLGVELFNRKQHRVSLTLAGREFYSEMKKLQPQFHALLDKITYYSTHKIIECCCVSTWDIFNMRYRFQNSDFKKIHPDVDVRLLEHKNAADCVPELVNGELDFGIMHLFSTVKTYCNYRILAQDVLWALFPKNHPLSNFAHVTPADLKEYTVLLSIPTMKQTLNELSATLNFLPRMEDPSKEYTMRRDQIVRRIAFDTEQCYTLLYESDIENLALKNVCSVPVSGCNSFPLVIAWKKGRELAPHEQDFLDYFTHLMSLPEITD
ncbi:LysR family transcriptional regulator [Hungatella hathewayi]